MPRYVPYEEWERLDERSLRSAPIRACATALGARSARLDATVVRRARWAGG